MVMPAHQPTQEELDLAAQTIHSALRRQGTTKAERAAAVAAEDDDD